MYIMIRAKNINYYPPPSSDNDRHSKYISEAGILFTHQYFLSGMMNARTNLKVSQIIQLISSRSLSSV